MGFFRLGKADRAAGGAGKAGDEDGEEEKMPPASGASIAGDPRGLASCERPSGTSERHGAGRSGLGDAMPARMAMPSEMGLGAVTASGQDTRERRKKSERRDRGGSEDLGPSSTGAGATPSQSSSMPVASSVNDFISKTKSQKRKGLKPSGPELIAYARYLGIDPVADHDLLWIAVEALEAPLPSTWSEHFDSNDRVFYYNASTRVSSWTHPLEHVYRETYTTIVNFRNSNLSPAERSEKLLKLQAECEQMERDVHREISMWTEHHDEQGHRFYFNAQEKQSTWTDPRPAQCHILYLKMKLVRVLSQCSGVTGVAAGAAAAAAASQGGEASRFAPSLSGTSPRRDGGGGGMEATKRAKVGGGVEPVDQFPRRGQGSTDQGMMGGGSARGSESDAMTGGIDNEGWADAEAEGDRHHHHKRKKDKKSKKKRDFVESGDELVSVSKERHNHLNHSQSEPAVTSKREAAPPPEAHEARGLGGGSYPAVPHNFAESESLSQIGRARPKAGIRLSPLQPLFEGKGGPSAASASSMEVSSASSGMHMSSSQPELKPLEKLPLEKLQPL